MSISRVALRNLNRNRVKTVLSIVAIVIGVSFYIYNECAAKGRSTSGFLNIINNESGPVQIYKNEYYPIRDEMPLYETISDVEEIEKFLEQEFYTSPRVRFSGLVISPKKEIPFEIIAVDPLKEEKVFKYVQDIGPRNITNGNFEMVMGFRGAKELGLVVGDALRLLADIEIKEGDRVKTITQLLDFTLVGIIKSDNVALSKYSAFVPRDILNDEYGMMFNNSVTEVVVRDRDYTFESMPTPKESPQIIKNKLPKELRENLFFSSWTNYDESQIKTLSTNELAPVFFFMTLLIIMLMSNTMLLSVMDRTREISMLRALGMDNYEIFKLLATEAGYLGFIGGALGVIGGFIISYHSVKSGFNIDLEFIEARDLDFTLSGTVKSAWSIKSFVVGFLGAIFTSLLSSTIPTLSALKMNIIKGIKHD